MTIETQIDNVTSQMDTITTEILNGDFTNVENLTSLTFILGAAIFNADPTSRATIQSAPSGNTPTNFITFIMRIK